MHAARSIGPPGGSWQNERRLTNITGPNAEATAVDHSDAADGLRSRRAVDYLWELHGFAGRHPKVTEAVELRNRISETLGTA